MTAAEGELCLDANVAAAYVAGELTMREAADVDRHIDRCADCRRHLSELARSARLDGREPPRVLGRGALVGRYVIEQQLGAGAMGVVYRAYDPELGRPVALKVLRAEATSGEDSRALRRRLAREAHAMAQLSHPHVVGVYDLIVDRDDIFVAMELIEGTSLGRWLIERRDLADVLRVFRQAGEGLAAAHSRGIVHRDFKPDNVLVDEVRGRVCVSDFGLAHVERPQARGAPLRETLDTGLTRTGAFMGTPAYMSPEHHRGEPATAHSDQFSFCVALYEALHGAPPFEGDTVEARAAAVMAERRRPRSRERVPARIDRILDRGMRMAPAERYPTMTELLEELALVPPQRHRWAAIALVVLAIVLGGAILARERRSTPAVATCPSPEARLTGVWDRARKERVKRAFTNTNKVYALDAWVGTERSLDAYVRDWSSMYAATCSAPPHDVTTLRRMACLEERLTEVRALVDVLERADAALVGQAIPAAESLARLSLCATRTGTSIQFTPPSDPMTLAKVAKVREVLARIKALHETQSWKAALPLVEPALADARATGYRPLEAEALMLVGAVNNAPTGDSRKAAAAYREAAAIADAMGDDRTRALALIRGISGASDGTAEMTAQLAQAQAAAERVRDDDEVQYSLGFILSARHLVAGRYADGEAEAQKTLASAKRAYGEQSWRTSLVLCVAAGAAGERGKLEEAIAMTEGALYNFHRAIGTEAPAVVFVHTIAASLLTESLRTGEAKAQVAEALRVSEREVGPDSAVTAGVLDELGRALLDEGKFDEALHVYRRSLPIQERAGRAEEPMLALLGLGRAHLGRGAPREAISPLERAVRTEHRPVKAMTHAEAELALAEALRRAKRTPARERELLLHARDAFRAAASTPRRERDLARIETLLADR